MEAGEYGLTRGTCFVERRLEVVAVAGLLWIFSWCVLGAAGFFVFFFSIFFFLRTHTACCKYEAVLPHLPLYQYPGPRNVGCCVLTRHSIGAIDCIVGVVERVSRAVGTRERGMHECVLCPMVVDRIVIDYPCILKKAFMCTVVHTARLRGTDYVFQGFSTRSREGERFSR